MLTRSQRTSGPHQSDQDCRPGHSQGFASGSAGTHSCVWPTSDEVLHERSRWECAGVDRTLR